MRELSLFSGAGGGLLASKLLEWRTLGYVEKNEYCQKVIKQWIFAIKTDGTMLESVDFQKYFVIGTEESFRWQYSRAIGAALPQDDYTRIKRDHDAVARGMERLEAIGNDQIPGVAALAWKILSGDL